MSARELNANQLFADELEALQEALAARSTEIAELTDVAPSLELATRLGAEIHTGAAISHVLQILKLRICSESARLAQLQAGLVSGLDSSPNPHIDYRG